MVKGLYHPAIHDFSRPVPSYWEATAPPLAEVSAPLEGAVETEVAIIGGGYCGLSTALHLARDTSIDCRVLEAGPIAWGASGRNGGFCGLAATKLSIAAMIKAHGLEAAQRFYASQVEAIDLVASLAETEAIDIQRAGSGNYEVAHHPKALQGLHDDADALTAHFGIATRKLSRDAFAAEVHDGAEQFGGAHIEVGFALHPLRFARGLADAAIRRGAILHPDSEVIAWETADDGRHLLRTARGSLRARQVVMATNGFMPEGLRPEFAGRVMPVLSNILVTRPLEPAELANQGWRNHSPICNARNLLFYYRLLPDNRLLLGARGDTRGTPENALATRNWMRKRVGEIFPAWQNLDIDYFWRGLVCMSLSRVPSIGCLQEDPSIWYGYGFHANGVNTAPWAGRALARAIAGVGSLEEAVPAMMRAQTPVFPFPRLRPWYLRAALLGYHCQDLL